MGTHYTSYAMIGVKIPVAHLYETVMEPPCKHVIPDGSKHCPVCGVKNQKVKKVYADRLMELLDIINTEVEPGYIWADHTEADMKDRCIYYGYGVSSDRDRLENKHYRNPDLGAILPAIRAKLEAEPLVHYITWTKEIEDSYGLYSLTIGR